MTSPLYVKIADALRERIGADSWAEGARLPAERQLCEEFGASSITVRRAIATLVAEGRLIRLQGKGTFVSSDHGIVQGPLRLTSFTEEIRLRGWKPSARVIKVRVEQAPHDVAAKLGIASSAQVVVIQRVRLADREPVGIQTAYLPALRFPGIERYDLGRQSLYELMRDKYSVRPATATEVYQASRADSAEAALLDVRPQSAVLRVERTTLDGAGQRIELVRSVLRGDRYTVALSLSASRQPRAAD